MVFVTHDMGAVERFCDRAMLLERGEVVDIGDPASIARQYNHHNFRRWREEGGTPEEELPPVDPAATIVHAGFESSSGETAVTSLQGETCLVRMKVHFREAIDEPAFTITLLDDTHRPVFTTNTDTQRIETGSFAAGTRGVDPHALRQLPGARALPAGGLGGPRRGSAPRSCTPT